MRVCITQKEYEALISILEQVETDYEAATNEEYLTNIGIEMNLVRNIIQKYKKERAKANTFLEVRAYVSEKNKNRNLRSRDIDNLTRKLLKRMKGGEK